MKGFYCGKIETFRKCLHKVSKKRCCCFKTLYRSLSKSAQCLELYRDFVQRHLSVTQFLSTANCGNFVTNLSGNLDRPDNFHYLKFCETLSSYVCWYQTAIIPQYLRHQHTHLSTIYFLHPTYKESAFIPLLQVEFEAGRVGCIKKLKIILGISSMLGEMKNIIYVLFIYITTTATKKTTCTNPSGNFLHTRAALHPGGGLELRDP